MIHSFDEPIPRSIKEFRKWADSFAEELETDVGRQLSPVTAHGRAVAASFWGRAWCRSIESYQD